MGKYDATVKELLSLVGGKENVLAVSHCATRLRIVLQDKKKYDAEAIKKLDGVQGLFLNSGQLQIIFGLNVPDYYQSFVDVSGIKGVDLKRMVNFEKKPNWFMSFIKLFPSVIMPMMSTMIGCALINVILVLVDTIAAQAFNVNLRGNAWFNVFYKMSGLVLNSLVIFICIGCARYWNSSIYNAVAIGGFLAIGGGITGTLLPMWSDYQTNPIGMLPYAQSIFTGMVGVKISSVVERYLNKHLPDNIKIFFTSFCALLAAILFIVIVFGPIMLLIERWLNTWVGELANPSLYGIGIGFFGMIFAPLVITGVHQALIPLAFINFAQFGFSPISAGILASNIAQAAAAFGVATLCKDDPKMKSMALTSASVALIGGVTEPAMFGVNLRSKSAFFCAIFGAFVGGWFMGLFGATTTQPGVPSCILSPILAIPNVNTHPGQANILTGNWNPLFIAAGIVITFFTTYLSYIIVGRKKVKENKSKFSQSMINIKTSFYTGWSKLKESSFVQGYGKLKQNIGFAFNQKAEFAHYYDDLPEKYKKPKGQMLSPLTGTFVEQKDIPDPTFASGAMGKGFAIEPKNGIVKAPFNGEVVMVFDTKHAIALKSIDGVEVLIHVGLDTVKLNGKGFKILCEKGEKVSAGETLMKFDMKKIQKAGLPTVTTVIVTNSSEYKNIEFQKENHTEANFNDVLTNINMSEKLTKTSKSAEGSHK